MPAAAWSIGLTPDYPSLAQPPAVTFKGMHLAGTARPVHTRTTGTYRIRHPVIEGETQRVIPSGVPPLHSWGKGTGGKASLPPLDRLVDVLMYEMASHIPAIEYPNETLAVLDKATGESMGCTFTNTVSGPKLDLVMPCTPADRAGLGHFIGRHVVRVNNEGVRSIQDIKRFAHLSRIVVSFAGTGAQPRPAQPQPQQQQQQQPQPLPPHLPTGNPSSASPHAFPVGGTPEPTAAPRVVMPVLPPLPQDFGLKTLSTEELQELSTDSDKLEEFFLDLSFHTKCKEVVAQAEEKVSVMLIQLTEAKDEETKLKEGMEAEQAKKETKVAELNELLAKRAEIEARMAPQYVLEHMQRLLQEKSELSQKLELGVLEGTATADEYNNARSAYNLAKFKVEALRKL